MNRDDRLAALKSLFACSIEEADRLNEAMSFATYRHKELLAHQGDQSSKMWLVIEGRAQLQIIGLDGQIQLLTAHGPGELFGAFPNEQIMIADISAQHTLSVLEIATHRMAELLEQEANLGTGLANILGRQFNAVLDRMAARITLTANGRVYSELLREAGDRDHISPVPVIAALALTAQTTRETGSRAINALERRGIIKRDKTHLQIVSRTMLKGLIV